MDKFAIAFTNDSEQVAHYEQSGGRKIFIGFWDTHEQKGHYRDQLGDTVKVDGKQRTLPEAAYADWVAGCAYTANMWLAEGPPEPGYLTTGGMMIAEARK